MTDKGSDDDIDLDEAFEESGGKRTDVSARDKENPTALVDVIAKEYERVHDDDASTTLTLRDKRLACIIRALDETDRLGDLSQDAWEAAPGEPDGDKSSRSGLLAGLLRAGLQETDGSLFDKDQDAYEQFREKYEDRTR